MEPRCTLYRFSYFYMKFGRCIQSYVVTVYSVNDTGKIYNALRKFGTLEFVRCMGENIVNGVRSNEVRLYDVSSMSVCLFCQSDHVSMMYQVCQYACFVSMYKCVTFYVTVLIPELYTKYRCVPVCDWILQVSIFGATDSSDGCRSMYNNYCSLLWTMYCQLDLPLR